MTRQEILAVAKPILFNTEMVRAILDGRKTVTRRVIKQDVETILRSQARADHPELSDSHFIRKLCSAPCQPRDYLYVRETWCGRYLPHGKWLYRYKATDPNGNRSPTGPEYDDEWEVRSWHPSIHMPKEAARLFLQVTDIKPCELWKCGIYSIFDIVSEGVNINETCRECIKNYGEPCCNKEDYEDNSVCKMLDEAREEFGKVWDRIWLGRKPLGMDDRIWAGNTGGGTLMGKLTAFERWNNYMREQNENAGKDQEEKLLPCPFCGGEAFLEVIPPHKHHFVKLPPYRGGAFVECKGCTCAMSAKTPGEAIADWNRRAKPEQPEAVHGKWIAMTNYPGTYSQCSCCGQKARGYTPSMKYCPSCGAKMEEAR